MIARKFLYNIRIARVIQIGVLLMNSSPPRKLLDVVCETIRLKHYSYRTEQTYLDWIKRYLLYHNKKHLRDTGAEEIKAFLTYLAVDKNVAAATKNQT